MRGTLDPQLTMLSTLSPDSLIPADEAPVYVGEAAV
jgi:hypothetical protein